MYSHRPDLLSLTFGLVFLALGLAAIAYPGGIPDLDPFIVLGALATAGGIGLVGSLATGDVHRQAARHGGRRTADAEAGHRRGMTPPPPPPPEHDEDVLSSVLDDPLFGPPIDPDELDRIYRETFGAADPAGSDRSPGEGTADGAAG